MASHQPLYTPTVIIHGGAGVLSPSNLPLPLLHQYRRSLSQILTHTRCLLNNGASALDAAVAAVSLFEDNPLFNCGRGSVFAADGTIEMEASVMVSSVRSEVNDGGDGLRGGAKRAAGVTLVKNTRHPIQLARELLMRAPEEGGGSHCQLSAPYVEQLAREWGLEMKGFEWFWTKKRWEEHLKGLRGEVPDVRLSQGTVGAVCLDQWGDLCVATSTGGLTNKCPGRIGDTPTVGAGYWAEAWREEAVVNQKIEARRRERMLYQRSPRLVASDHGSGSVMETLDQLLGSCLGTRLADIRSPGRSVPLDGHEKERLLSQSLPNASLSTTRLYRKAVAMSGTGNGDSFLRTAACRTAAAISRFSSTPSYPISLKTAVQRVAGPGGELQRSAGGRWEVTGEGQGGIIGIEVIGEDDREEDGSVSNTAGEGKVLFDFNCGGMFRAYVDENGKAFVGVFRGDDAPFEEDGDQGSMLVG